MRNEKVYYVLVPISSQLGNSIGREIFTYSRNPVQTDQNGDSYITVFKNFPTRVETYKVYYAIEFGNEVYIITEKTPIKIHVIDEVQKTEEVI